MLRILVLTIFIAGAMKKKKKTNKQILGAHGDTAQAQAQAQKLHKIESQIEGPTAVAY